MALEINCIQKQVSNAEVTIHLIQKQVSYAEVTIHLFSHGAYGLCKLVNGGV